MFREMPVRLFIIILLLSYLNGQAQDCSKNFHVEIAMGNKYLRQNKLKKAFDEFQMAQIVARECNINSDSATVGEKKVFDKVEKQLQDALKANKRADSSERITRHSLATVDSFVKVNKQIKISAKNYEDSLTKKFQAQIDSMQISTKSNNISEGISINSTNQSSTTFETPGYEPIKDSINNSLNRISSKPINLKENATFCKQLEQVTYQDVNKYLNNFFLLDIKKSIDSLIQNLKAKNNFFQNKDDQLVYEVEQKLESDNQFSLVLYDSCKSIINQKKSQNISEDLFYIYLRSVLYYSWNLMDDHKLDSTNIILQETQNIVAKNKITSAKIFYGLAGLENALSRYNQDINKETEGFEHSKNAVEYSKKAVLLNTQNYLFQKKLSIYLRNMQYVSDSLLSQNDKNNYINLGCDIANFIEAEFPKKGYALSLSMNCAEELTQNLIDSEQYQEALETLTGSIEKIDTYIQYDSTKISYYLLKCRVYNKMADISKFNTKNIAYQKNYTLQAIKSWLDAVGRGTNFQSSELSDIEDYYKDIITNVDDCFDSLERKKIYSDILASIERVSPKNTNAFELAYVNTTVNLEMGELLLNNKTQNDSLAALIFFTTAINSFEKMELLKHYIDYSEDFSKFCEAYSQSIKIYISLNNYDLAKENYNKMIRIFDTIYKKYRFDFYFNQNLISASKLYGEYLYKKQKYKDAIPALLLASIEGIKQSSDYLIDIYSKFGDTSNLRITKIRESYQSNSMERFTIPTLFGNINYPFYVYIVDRDPTYPYKGIDDQVEWVKKARGGIIPNEVAEAFTKLQIIAWEDSNLFTTVCDYALGSNDENNTAYLKQANKYTKNIDSLHQVIRSINVSSDKEKKAYAELINEVVNFALLLIKNVDVKSADSLIMQNVGPTYNELKNFQIAIAKINDTVDKIIMYKALLRLYKKYSDKIKYDPITDLVIQAYNSLGWYQLLNGQFPQSERTIRGAMTLSKSTLYLYTNLPPILLFEGKFEEAKKLYLEFKDIPFDPENNLPTFRDAFLQDINTFEKNNVVPTRYKNDLEKIKSLLLH